MNKKVDEVVIKKRIDEEDEEIKKVAYKKKSSQKILLVILSIIFCLVLSTSALFMGNYFKIKYLGNKYQELIEINSNKSKVMIINNGEIDEEFTYFSFDTNEKEIVIERINSIELIPNKKSKNNRNIKFDVKYNILKNNFIINEFATNNSEVLVRFSYSFDSENWTYINNVISTTQSTLNPLMGNYYDISGVESNLKIATNYELTSESGKSNKMYWRSETIIKNKKNYELNANLKANFKIEYKGND